MAMAEFERPLSNTALNKSMMQKIFLAQTLNTGRCRPCRRQRREASSSSW